MRLTTKYFFDYYIINPFARDLPLADRILALALSVLFAPLAFGFLHIRSFYLQKKNAKKLELHISEKNQKLALGALKTHRVQFSILNSYSSLSLTQETVIASIQNQFISTYYSQPFPNRDQVKVPLKNSKTGEMEWRLWKSLTKKEKIQVYNEGAKTSNKLSNKTPEKIIDKLFFAGSDKPYIDGDPRKTHGNDHSVRTSIFSGVFGYLYQKFHPGYNISQNEIRICQLLGAGHDAGRENEGPDVYDKKSGELTRAVFSALGEKNEQLLNLYEKSIEEKDSKELFGKHLYAKCLQNADSAEFVRLLLHSPIQEAPGFENSRLHLDIYQELKAIAGSKKEYVLKNGLTFGNFLEELDALRFEMNQFIYRTHSKKFRKKALENKENYYHAFLSYITPFQFPVLHEVLVQANIKISHPSPEEFCKKRQLENILKWREYGFDKIEEKKLLEFSNLLNSEDSISQNIRNEINVELEARRLSKEQFLEAKKHVPKDWDLLFSAYENFPLLFKQKYRFEFLQELKKRGDIKNWLLQKINQGGTSYALALTEYLHEELKQNLEQLQRVEPKEKATFLQKLAEEVLLAYQRTDLNRVDPSIQTTVALAYRKAAEIYIFHGLNHEANDCLDQSAKGMIFHFSTPFKKVFSNQLLIKDISYVLTDCGFLRKRKMGIQEKEIDGKKIFEFTFEIPSYQRDEFEKFLDLIPTKQKKQVETVYEKKIGRGYTTKKVLKGGGKELKLEPEEGVILLIGSDREYWNHYHSVRIRINQEKGIDALHRVLCRVGLPMALFPSREDDIKNELLSRILAFRFPESFYGDPIQKKMAPEIFRNLQPDQKEIVIRDLKAAKLTEINKNHHEYVIPHIGEEAWQYGVRSLGCFIWAGANFEETAAVMAEILKKGMMSAAERHKNGIIGLGCAPKTNNKAGSGNQVFTRILTKNLFEKNFPLSTFALEGPILILFNPQVLERLPYSYSQDRIGVRNPHFRAAIHIAQNQIPTFGFYGKEIIEKRRNFKSHIEDLLSRDFPLNETMFDLNIGAKYIEKLIVRSEKDRLQLIAHLQREGVFYINENPLDQAIQVANELKAEMVNDFYHNNPYTEYKDASDYI